MFEPHMCYDDVPSDTELYECGECGAVVRDTVKHSEWHIARHTRWDLTIQNLDVITRILETAKAEGKL